MKRRVGPSHSCQENIFGEKLACVLAAQLCPTLCNPMDCSPPGSSVHGISQARIQEWVAIPSSRRSSRPRDQTCVSYFSLHLLQWQAGSLPLSHLGSPKVQLFTPHVLRCSVEALRSLFNPSGWKAELSPRAQLCAPVSRRVVRLIQKSPSDLSVSV